MITVPLIYKTCNMWFLALQTPPSEPPLSQDYVHTHTYVCIHRHNTETILNLWHPPSVRTTYVSTFWARVLVCQDYVLSSKGKPVHAWSRENQSIIMSMQGTFICGYRYAFLHALEPNLEHHGEDFLNGTLTVYVKVIKLYWSDRVSDGLHH